MLIHRGGGPNPSDLRPRFQVFFGLKALCYNPVTQQFRSHPATETSRECSAGVFLFPFRPSTLFCAIDHKRSFFPFWVHFRPSTHFVPSGQFRPSSQPGLVRVTSCSPSATLLRHSDTKLSRNIENVNFKIQKYKFAFRVCSLF